MKRHGNLWPIVTGFPNLLAAAEKAKRGKMKRENVARFHLDLERNLWELHDELCGKTYTPGGYETFYIYEPKPRLISAAPYRDRVVHHALCRVLETVFDPTFIDDSYACRRGKGTHAAIDRFTEFARRNHYVLKRMQAEYEAGQIDAKQVRQRLQSWIGHASHANTIRLRKRLLYGTTFSRRQA